MEKIQVEVSNDYANTNYGKLSHLLGPTTFDRSEHNECIKASNMKSRIETSNYYSAGLSSWRSNSLIK
ncbi:hypothetical protein MUGA111182_04940 [Mucilaginibacter galii]|uniref:Uncharacterized protein n=1 Tax=Mucilaginibacter galii TaxID=2005073 RepID=A0A917N286_9SPHI|nr:hypothetical protein GCM10011425_10190 [Mucilaginibacter galii]